MRNECVIAALLLLAGCATVDPDLGGDDIPFSVNVAGTVEGVGISEDGMVYACGVSRDPGWAGYVVKYNRAGEQKRFVHLRGAAQGVAVYEDHVSVGGVTSDPGFPLVNPWKGSVGPKPNCFLMALDWELDKIFWSTVFTAGWKTAWDGVSGGSIRDVRVDEYGNTYALAADQSMDHPTTDALMGHPGGWSFYPDRPCCWSCEPGASPKWSNVLCGAFDKDGKPIRWLTLGGSGADTTDGAIAVEDGYLYVGGRTKSDDWPIQNAIQGKRSDGGFSYFDGFYTKINRDLSGIEYSSYISGKGGQSSIAGASVQNGRLAIVGRTRSSSWPLVNAAQSRNNGDYDGVVTVLDGSRIVFSTFLGTKGYDCLWAAAWDGSGRLWVAGQMNGIAYLGRFSASGQLEMSENRPGQCVNSMCIRGDTLVLGIAAGDNGTVRKEKF